MRSAPAPIALVSPLDGGPLTEADGALVDGSGRRFPIVAGIPRFVESEHYAASFGFQWHRFRTTQLDAVDALGVSRERFFASTGWKPEILERAAVLEVGSGAGRFSRVVLEHTAAELYSVDLSNAVDVNLANNGPHERLHLFQASIYALPFPPQSFDRVFCFGVLQHTPDVRRSIVSLARMVRPGGELAVDFYSVKGWWTRVHAKYLLRPVLRRLSSERLLTLIERNIDWMLWTSARLRRIGLGRVLGRFVPVADPRPPLSEDGPYPRVREWAIMDTFDMFSPAYDQPQRIPTVARWFEESGLRVTHAGFITYQPGLDAAVVRGRRDDAS